VAGFGAAIISDHYHPWTRAQGSSPFVWSVLGAIAGATDRLRVGTGVVCPTMRIHPAVIAQAAATTALLFQGRFFLGVGSGECLNEHILGDRWPPAPVRLAMLEEAVAVMRRLWGGGQVTHYGEHYTVENAELFDLPETPVPVYVSAFGPKAVALAARTGDGYVGTAPDPDLVAGYTEQAGTDKPRLATGKCCWGSDEGEARKLAHRLWPNLGLPGELAQELPTPAHFEQAAALVTEDMIGDTIPCGPDPERYVASIREYADAGYTELYLHNIGDDQDGFIDFFQREVRPRLG
jgi:G6PDH family F420-dependent oxidoreductase